MTAPIIPLAPARLRREAIAKGERVRDLAEELAAYKPGEPRAYMAGYYEGQGWAPADELLMALEALEEAEKAGACV